jgi:rhodanese-related sulfurtransferase
MTKEAVREKMLDKNTVVLDVFPDDDFKKQHIKGSESCEFGQNVRSFAQTVERKYGKEKFFIIYCANRENALSSHNAAMVLNERGFTADDYPGGTQEWSEAGFPTAGTEDDFRAAFKEPVVAN